MHTGNFTTKPWSKILLKIEEKDTHNVLFMLYKQYEFGT